MKKFGRILALLLAAAMAFSLAACTDMDAAIKQAQKSLSKVTSVDMELSLDLAVTTNGTAKETNVNTQITRFLNPNRTKTVITATSGKEKQVVQNYFIEASDENGQSVYYENTFNVEKQSDNLLSLVAKGDAWIAVPADESASSVLSNTVISLEDIAEYAAQAENFDVVGTEQKYGLNHTVVQGVLTGQAMKDAVVNSGALSCFGDSDIQEYLITAMDGMSDASISVKSWIQDTAMYPVRTIIDMTNLMDALADALAKEIAQDDSVTVDSCVLEVTMKNFNRATEFELPAAAEEALASLLENAGTEDAESTPDA